MFMRAFIDHQELTSPEVIATGRVTERTDVYDFGSLLLELLSSVKSTEDSATIQDPVILAGEGGVTASFIQQLKAVLDLVRTCKEEDPETRPTMIDVTKELRRIEGFVP
ncbi:non-functional pseudokinase ZED1-like [Fagus crenata]